MIRRPHRQTFRMSDKQLARYNRVRSSRELFYKDWSKFIIEALDAYCAAKEAEFPQLKEPAGSDKASELRYRGSQTKRRPK